MRKWFIISAILVCLIIPVSAQAQSAVVFDKVLVQLWPEYDKPATLAIINMSIGSSVKLPATITFRFPEGAILNAVARDENGQPVLIPHNQDGATTGEWQSLTFTADQPGTYRVEYYFALSKENNARQFNYVWAGDYDVKDFQVELQEPIGATGVQTTPALSAVKVGNNDGLTYHTGDFAALSAGKPFSVSVQYNKDNEQLTASALKVTASGGLNQNNNAQNFISTYLVYILVGIGVLLLLGGGYYLWRSSRRSMSKSRRRHRSVEDDDDEDDDDVTVYCHQCGKRAAASDKFCRTCGSRIRRE